MNVVEHPFVDKLGKTVDKHSLLGKSPLCATKIKPRYSPPPSTCPVDGGSNYGVYTTKLSIPSFPKFSPSTMWRRARSKISISRKNFLVATLYTDYRDGLLRSPHIHTLYYDY